MLPISTFFALTGSSALSAIGRVSRRGFAFSPTAARGSSQYDRWPGDLDPDKLPVRPVACEVDTSPEGSLIYYNTIVREKWHPMNDEDYESWFEGPLITYPTFETTEAEKTGKRFPPVKPGKNLYQKAIKYRRFPQTFEGQKTRAMIAFEPTSIPRGLRMDGMRVWGGLAANGAPDAAVKILHDPALFNCAAPKYPPTAACLEILINRVGGWIEHVGPAIEHTYFAELRASVGRLIDLVERYDIQHPIILLQLVSLVSRESLKSGHVAHLERELAMARLKVQITKGMGKWESVHAPLPTGKAEWVFINLAKQDLSPEIRTAWDPLLGNLSVEVIRSHLLECLDKRSKHPDPPKPPKPYAITVAAAHHHDDPVCRVLLLELQRVVDDLPEETGLVLRQVAGPETLASREIGPTSPTVRPPCSLVKAERALETIQRARVILAQHHPVLVTSDVTGWEAAFPGISSAAADMADRPVLYDRWEACFSASSPTEAIDYLMTPDRCGLQELTVPPDALCAFIKSIPVDDLSKSFSSSPPSNDTSSILAERLVQAVLVHHPENCWVLLELQTALLKAKAEGSELDAARNAVEQHIESIRPSWVEKYGSTRVAKSKDMCALMTRVDDIRHSLGQSAATWDVLGAQISKFGHRRRLFAFLLELEAKPAEERPPPAVIISFVGPSLYQPRDPYVLLIALKILDGTSLVGTLVTTTPAERKVAIEGRVDAWAALVADMQGLYLKAEDSYEEFRAARKGRGAFELARQLKGLNNYPYDVAKYLLNMDFLLPDGVDEGDWTELAEIMNDWKDPDPRYTWLFELAWDFYTFSNMHSHAPLPYLPPLRRT